jgi:hypothetical protein
VLGSPPLGVKVSLALSLAFSFTESSSAAAVEDGAIEATHWPEVEVHHLLSHSAPLELKLDHRRRNPLTISHSANTISLKQPPTWQRSLGGNADPHSQLRGP